ncbi:hypothetical protein B4U80_03845 [Leptotrombidium deliense]|nr:hypothetical protein B4U80_03845 [Leptotrombidium deliense]
MGKIRV